MHTIDLGGGRWCVASHVLTDLQEQRLEAALAQGGMPRLFWPGVLALVRQIVAEAAIAKKERDAPVVALK